jgi:uncharacterized protein (UPF0332 family)
LDESISQLLDSHLKKARDKLRVAAQLLDLGSYDDSVSRAYYAAFHAAQAMLASQGLEADSHAGVKTLFGLHFIKTKRLDAKFGRYLKNLKDDREEGDYDAISFLDAEVARNALRAATEFVDKPSVSWAHGFVEERNLILQFLRQERNNSPSLARN